MVREIHHCGFYDALKIINQDFGLMLDTKTPKRKRTMVIVSKVIQLLESDPASKLDVIPTEWTQEHYDYWHPITPATLSLYQVIPISDIISSGKITELHGEIAFAFMEHLPYIKVLRPYADKRSKWKNTNPKDHLHGVKVAQEWGEVQIITKSLKDVMALWQCNYQAVGLMSEGVRPDDVPLKLADKAYVLMDNDEPGRLAAKKWEEAGYKTIFIEEEGCKDMFDLIKIKGIAYAKNWLKDVII